MRRIVSLLVFSLVACSLEELRGLGLREQLSFAICAIETPIPQLISENGYIYQIYRKRVGQSAYEPLVSWGSGTGFFVSSGQFFYLVTAQHIATNCNDDGFVVVGNVVGEETKPIKFSFVDVAGTNSTSYWIHDTSNDISVLPVFGSVDFIKKYVSGRAYGPQHMPTNAAAPSRDAALNIVGFAGHEGTTGLFSPLSRETRAASGLLGSSGVSCYFYLQDPSIQGYSGSPVLDFDDHVLANGILRVGGIPEPKCVGIVSSTFGDNTGGKMARIVPSFYIMRLMRQFESTPKFHDLASDLVRRLN